jgi:NAD(P)-dependent dehydrogenase (short-subunit alcohol dehydrogenase family)
MTKDLFDFTGKTVLITGGSTGIGRASALAFARHGAKIVIGDLNEPARKESVELIKKEGAQALFVKTNISQTADVTALVERTVSTFGGLDCAFNNAGIAHAPKPIEELDEESFDRVIAVDLKGCFFVHEV